MQQARPLQRAGDSGTGIPISSVNFKVDAGLRVVEEDVEQPPPEHDEEEDSDGFSGQCPQLPLRPEGATQLQKECRTWRGGAGLGWAVRLSGAGHAP